MPSVESRLEVVADFAATLRPLGSFNVVYSDGDALFIHSHRRKRDDGEECAPGLYLLVRSPEQEAVDLSESGIMVAPFAQQMALVASVPLTDEDWQPIPEGKVIALKHGLVRAHVEAPAEAGTELSIVGS
jgi:glutamine amidotransferase